MKKQDLLNILEKVQPGLATKDMIEQSTSFAFVNGRVITYNDEISISSKCPGLEGLTGAVKAQELYKFLAKTKVDEIDLTITENELRIKAGKAKVGMVLETKIKLPLFELGQYSEFKKLPENFIDGLKMVRFCCAKDMSRPKLTCIHVRTDGVMESCDNFRAIRYQMESECSEKFLLPGGSTNILINYPVTMIASSPGWVHFTDAEQSLVFSCRVFADTYANLDTLFQLKDLTIFTFPPESLEILQRAEIFTKGDILLNQQIEITVKGGRLFFKAKKAGSWFEEWVKIVETTPFSTTIHPQFLQDILKLTLTCEILPGRMIKFTGENWEHVASMSVPT